MSGPNLNNENLSKDVKWDYTTDHQQSSSSSPKKDKISESTEEIFKHSEQSPSSKQIVPSKPTQVSEQTRLKTSLLHAKLSVKIPDNSPIHPRITPQYIEERMSNELEKLPLKLNPRDMTAIYLNQLKTALILNKTICDLIGLSPSKTGLEDQNLKKKFKAHFERIIKNNLKSQGWKGSALGFALLLNHAAYAIGGNELLNEIYKRNKPTIEELDLSYPPITSFNSHSEIPEVLEKLNTGAIITESFKEKNSAYSEAISKTKSSDISELLDHLYFPDEVAQRNGLIVQLKNQHLIAD
jgi:hypothetical protein